MFKYRSVPRIPFGLIKNPSCFIFDLCWSRLSTNIATDKYTTSTFLINRRNQPCCFLLNLNLHVDLLIVIYLHISSSVPLINILCTSTVIYKTSDYSVL